MAMSSQKVGGFILARPANKHEDKKRELLLIAEKLFVEKGFQQTSVDDILFAGGISKGGFYHYFKSKDDLLSESINSLLDEVAVILQKIANDDKLDAKDKLNRFFIEKSKFQSSKYDYANFLGAMMQTDVSQYIFYVTMVNKLVPPLARIIKQGVDEGVFNVEFPEETADILTRVISSAVQSPLYYSNLNNAEKHKRYVDSVQYVISRTLGLKELVNIYPNLGGIEND
jgi:AcrR family transcriptional regulator